MNNQVKQLKLLSDLVWGDEFGRLDWISSSCDWQRIVQLYGDNILTVTRIAYDYLGNPFEKIVGLLIVAFPKAHLVHNIEAIIQNEWYLSHPEHWQLNGAVCYLSEIIIHPEYRHADILTELLTQFESWRQVRNIHLFYATGVSAAGVQVLKRFDNCHLLAIKADNRQVYQIGAID